MTTSDAINQVMGCCLGQYGAINCTNDDSWKCYNEVLMNFAHEKHAHVQFQKYFFNGRSIIQASLSSCHRVTESLWIMSIASCKTAESPLLTHWRYCSLARSHRCEDCDQLKDGALMLLSLTHFPLDKMATISQTTFWNAFSWMKNYGFQQWCR